MFINWCGTQQAHDNTTLRLWRGVRSRGGSLGNWGCLLRHVVDTTVVLLLVARGLGLGSHAQERLQPAEQVTRQMTSLAARLLNTHQSMTILNASTKSGVRHTRQTIPECSFDDRTNTLTMVAMTTTNDYKRTVARREAVHWNG
jgi:hypothetical protein